MKEYIKLKENGKLIINTSSITVEDADWHKDKVVASVYIDTLDIVIPVVFSESQVFDFVSQPYTYENFNVYGEFVQREFAPTKDEISEAMTKDIHETVKAMLLAGEEFTNE